MSLLAAIRRNDTTEQVLAARLRAEEEGEQGGGWGDDHHALVVALAHWREDFLPSLAAAAAPAAGAALLPQGAVNLALPIWGGGTLLHYFAGLRHHAAVQALIALGFDAARPDSYGRTPLAILTSSYYDDADAADGLHDALAAARVV